MLKSKRIHNKRGYYMLKLLTEIGHCAPLAVSTRNRKTHAGKCVRINSWRNSLFLFFSIAITFPWCYIIISYSIMYFSFYFMNCGLFFSFDFFFLYLFIYFFISSLARLVSARYLKTILASNAGVVSSSLTRGNF